MVITTLFSLRLITLLSFPLLTEERENQLLM